MTIYIATDFDRRHNNQITHFDDRTHLLTHAIVEEGLDARGLNDKSTIAEICNELSFTSGRQRVRQVTREEALELLRSSLPKNFPGPHQRTYYPLNPWAFKDAGFPKYVWEGNT
tara:strand:- start:139 stop:480 length:342 start_codon:yes stop_codon:yes gene_type:complete